MNVESAHVDSDTSMINYYLKPDAISIGSYGDGERNKIPHDAPFQIYMVTTSGKHDPETSAAGANRTNDITYSMTVTMPDGSTIVITKEQAIKAIKAIHECTMMPDDSTP